MTAALRDERPAAGRRAGLFWALVPVMLLVASVTGESIMASIATHDPGFALEKNYYQRAVHFDDEQAQRAENARLGLGVSLALRSAPGGVVEASATVRDRSGAPVRGATVRAEAFANARAADRHELGFVEQQDGRYLAHLTRPRPGLWEFRFVVLHDDARFTEVVRLDVPHPGGALAP